jgi:hypothetical protein
MNLSHTALEGFGLGSLFRVFCVDTSDMLWGHVDPLMICGYRVLASATLSCMLDYLTFSFVRPNIYSQHLRTPLLMRWHGPD